jgi:hypothetical protein
MKSYRFPQSFIAELLGFVTFGFIAASYIQAEQIIYFPLDTNPGWTTEGYWAFGVLLGEETFMEKNWFRPVLINKRQQELQQLL